MTIPLVRRGEIWREVHSLLTLIAVHEEASHRLTGQEGVGLGNLHGIGGCNKKKFLSVKLFSFSQNICMTRRVGTFNRLSSFPLVLTQKGRVRLCVVALSLFKVCVLMNIVMPHNYYEQNYLPRFLGYDSYIGPSVCLTSFTQSLLFLI